MKRKPAPPSSPRCADARDGCVFVDGRCLYCKEMEDAESAQRRLAAECGGSLAGILCRLVREGQEMRVRIQKLEAELGRVTILEGVERHRAGLPPLEEQAVTTMPTTCTAWVPWRGADGPGTARQVRCDRVLVRRNGLVVCPSCDAGYGPAVPNSKLQEG